MDVEPIILDIIREMVKIPAAARSWRTTVNEAFNDVRFFNCSPAVASKWKPLVKALVDGDKTVFSDILGKNGSHVP